jgi:hypothetical protein
MDAVMSPLECRGIPVVYGKESALFVQYCLVEQKCKINTTGGGKIIC